MSAADQIIGACGLYIGIAERGRTAMACLARAGIAEQRAMSIVADQMATDVAQEIAAQRTYWHRASDYMPSDVSQRIHEREEIINRLRALVPKPQLHPAMAQALKPFTGRSAA